jgi:hypothetical protein
MWIDSLAFHLLLLAFVTPLIPHPLTFFLLIRFFAACYPFFCSFDTPGTFNQTLHTDERECMGPA